MSLNKFVLKWGDFWAPAVLSFLQQTWFGDNRETYFLAQARGGSWLVDFLFQGLEFLAFVRMNTLTYEWSLGSSYEPIRNLVVGFLATVGGACATAANHPSADGKLLYWIFQLFFIHKKDRGKVRRKKKLPFIKTCPGTNVLTCFSFLARTNSKNFSLFTSFHVWTPSTYYKQWSQPGRKSGTTSAEALDIKNEHQNWRKSVQGHAFLHSCGFKSTPQKNHRIQSSLWCFVHKTNRMMKC